MSNDPTASEYSNQRTRRGVGTLFIDEQSIPIARIYLHDGKFQIESIALREARVIPAGCEIRVHDPDGLQVAVCPGHHDRNVRVLAGQSVTLPLHVNEVEGWPRR